MDNYYANQYSYFDNSDTYGGNQSNQGAYGGGQSNPSANTGAQSTPDAYGGGQGNPNAYAGDQKTSNAYGGGQGNPNAYGGGGGQSTSNAYGGGQGNPNVYAGDQKTPNAYGGGQGNSNAYGGSQNTPNAYGGGQGNPNAYGGGQSNPNAYGGQNNPNAYGGGQANSNAYGGGQGNANAFGGSPGNLNAYQGGQEEKPNAYGGGQGNANAYGGGQGNPNAYGGGQGNPNAYGGSQSNPNAYEAGNSNPNAYGGGQGNSGAYGGGQANFGAYGGGQANFGAYGGGQAKSGTYGDEQAYRGGASQGSSSAYGAGQGNSAAYNRENSSAYGGDQGDSSSYGGDKSLSIAEQAAAAAQGDQIYASRNENDSRKIFVGGLSWDVTTDDLYEYFQQFGEVVDANLKMNPATNQSRGFGFILFKEQAAVDRTVAHPEHILKGRTIDPKRAVAEGSKELNSKIFVGGIDPRMTKEEIVEAFTKFGTVKQIELPYDKVKNERRGFGFITFESEDIAEIVCRNGKVPLGKRKVDVRRLNTKDNRPTPDAMTRGRMARASPTTPPNRFPHQGRGRGAPARGAFNDGYVDPNVYQNNGMYRSGCPEDDDEFSAVQTAYDAIVVAASAINLPIWGDCGGAGFGGFNQTPFRGGRGGFDRSKRGGPSPRGNTPGRGGGGPARGGTPGRGGTGSQTGAGFHPYNR